MGTYSVYDQYGSWAKLETQKYVYRSMVMVERLGH